MPSYVTYHIFAATVQRVTSDSVAAKIWKSEAKRS